MTPTVPDLVVAPATPADAVGVLEVIHAAFGARPVLDPPATAGAETLSSVAAALADGGGLYATLAGRPAGAVLLASGPEPGVVEFRRVSVHPDAQGRGVASALVEAALERAAVLGHTRVELFARAELPETVGFWRRRGFEVARPAPYGMVLARPLPVAVEVPDGPAMQRLGERLAPLLEPGDLVLASGGLGAGKTTLTQGIGRGLGSTGAVISPTFVLSRVHPSAAGRPTLVHVDAYRLGSSAELDDLDLDATLPEAVTVVEWGTGLAEGLADSRLEVDIRPDAGDGRLVLLRPVGRRWDGVDLSALRDAVRVPA